MFMDDSLNIDPSVLNTTMDDQMNLFSMEHENKYGELMNELIEIFIPPEGATGEELENAKRDMQKYSDYRTYLSFDMEQIVDGDEKLTIGLSKMIKKTLVRRTEPIICCITRKFCTGLWNSSFTKSTKNSKHPSGCLR